MEHSSSPIFLNIARPYALAAFEWARDHDQIPGWKAFLESAAEVAKQQHVVRLISNPEIRPGKLFDLFHEVLATIISPEQKNFLLLLAQNKRLSVLPEIAELFHHYEAELEKISNVRVVTAVELDEQYKQKLVQALTKRIHHKVTLNVEIDPAILGGAMIHIGDRVIDGSVRGKLNRLLQDLTSY